MPRREVRFKQNGLTPNELSDLNVEFGRRDRESDAVAIYLESGDWQPYEGMTTYRLRMPIIKIKEERYL